jgi:modification methylase
MQGIYCGYSQHLLQDFPDNSVSLVITSPPYNVGKEYEGDVKALEDYLGYDLWPVWRECTRVLRPGGRLCVNIAGCWRKPYVPLHHLIGDQLQDLGLLMRGEIIWDKGASVGSSTAWGSFKSASNPVLRDQHEYILVFCKDEYKLVGKGSDLTADEFCLYTKSVWQIPAKRNHVHPAVFPIELPMRLIKLYSFPGDFVLDPFCGVGATCLAAQKLERQYIGIDCELKYVKEARRLLEC